MSSASALVETNYALANLTIIASSHCRTNKALDKTQAYFSGENGTSQLQKLKPTRPDGQNEMRWA